VRFNDDDEIALSCEREHGETRVRAVGTDLEGNGLIAEGTGDSFEEALVDLLHRISEMREVF
jgi:hypothetical protein